MGRAVFLNGPCRNEDGWATAPTFSTRNNVWQLQDI